MASRKKNKKKGSSMSTKDPPPPLRKIRRGRFKKLRKRIQAPITGSPTSGLVFASEVEDWQDLTSTVVGPSIRVRKSTVSTNPQRADGEAHRDVLWNMVVKFLSSSQNDKLEVHEQFTCPRIPPWSTLHNPCTIQSMAIVEIQVKSSDSDIKNVIQQHVPVLASNNDDDKTKTIFPVQTRWFQGYKQLKSVTDILMYATASKKNTARKRRKMMSTHKLSDEDLMKRTTEEMHELVIQPPQRNLEGFPIAVDTEKQKSMRQHMTPPAEGSRLPSLDQAKDIVNSAAVSIRNGSDEKVFVATATNATNDDTVRVFAVDCEMVKTKNGPELARVTLIQLTRCDMHVEQIVSYTVVLDELVKPYEPVLDYVTEYSGVTADILNATETRLEQIQAAILSMIHSNDILIGHSLENDLRALCLVHDKVVDTALVFRPRKGSRKYSLRHLSATLLGMTIQSGHGHCSEEDAVAALNLAVRRAREGSYFCIKEKSDDQQHVLEMVRDGQIVCVGPNEWLQQHVTPFSNSAHALTCETVQDPNHKAVTAWLTSPTRQAKLVWSRLVAETETDLAKVNDFLSELKDKMLPGTLLLVCVQPNLAAAEAEAKQREVCMDPRSSLGWNVDQEQAYQRLADKSRSGMAYWIGDSCSSVSEAQLQKVEKPKSK